MMTPQKSAPALPWSGWWVSEWTQRAMLGLNHLLLQEPEAQRRLARFAGRGIVVHTPWAVCHAAISTAGLLEPADPGLSADLSLRLAPGLGAQDVLLMLRDQQKPPVQVEGDVLLAAEVQWLFDHVRWNPEEDLARIVGDVWAHRVSRVVNGVAGMWRGRDS